MKLFLSLSALFSYSFLLSQPTILEQFAPVAGTSWTEYSTDELEGISLGPTGPSQVWTYTNFTEDFEAEALDFLDPASLPSGFDGMFPDAEMAFYYEEDSTAQFLYAASNGFYLDGFATLSEEIPPPNNQQDFDPDLIFVPLDFTYVDDRFEQATTEIFIEDVFPLLLRSNIFTDMVADGYGTITTPAGTFTDVLRVRMFQYRVDSVFADTNMDGDYEFLSSTGPSDTTITYNHMQNGDPLLIASIEMNITESEIIGFNYIVSGAVGVDEYDVSSTFVVYPNPSTGKVTIDFSAHREPTLVEVYDLQGRLVYAEVPQVSGNLYALDLVGLSKGLYALIILSEGQRISASLAIE